MFSEDNLDDNELYAEKRRNIKKKKINKSGFPSLLKVDLNDVSMKFISQVLFFSHQSIKSVYKLNKASFT